MRPHPCHVPDPLTAAHLRHSPELVKGKSPWIRPPPWGTHRRRIAPPASAVAQGEDGHARPAPRRPAPPPLVGPRRRRAAAVPLPAHPGHPLRLHRRRQPRLPHRAHALARPHESPLGPHRGQLPPPRPVPPVPAHLLGDRG